MAENLDLKSFIRNVPDFPKPGIMFRDITPLLANAEAFGESIRQFADHFRDEKPTAILAADTHAFHYELEYGSDSLELHTDAVSAGDRVLLVDDLLATGGTMQACAALSKKCGAEIAGFAFLIELDFLNGRENLLPHNVLSLIHYNGED